VVIESCRSQCVVVGEDLGTVPNEVRERMQQHGFHRMFVGPFEISLEEHPPLKEPSEVMVASINTHDMATFSAFWSGLDVEDRHRMGLLDAEAVDREKEYRLRLQEMFLSTFGLSKDPNDLKLQLQVARHWLAHLAASQARYLIVNLEDLWLETASQNVPGTGLDRSNWQHKARLTLNEIRNSADVIEILNEVSRLRQTEEPG
jgi:4-alpha-glucanotransferase